MRMDTSLDLNGSRLLPIFSTSKINAEDRLSSRRHIQTNSSLESEPLTQEAIWGFLACLASGIKLRHIGNSYVFHLSSIHLSSIHLLRNWHRHNNALLSGGVSHHMKLFRGQPDHDSWRRPLTNREKASVWAGFGLIFLVLGISKWVSPDKPPFSGKWSWIYQSLYNSFGAHGIAVTFLLLGSLFLIVAIAARLKLVRVDAKND